MPALSQINASEKEEVSAALAQIPILPPMERSCTGSWHIAPLPSLTNRSFLVERGEGEAYVLRLPGRGTARYIDRAGEAANARAAAAIGLAPPILHADPASGVMLSRYLSGAVPLSPARLKEPDHFRAAIGLLKRLHESGLAFQGEMRLYPKIDQYLAMASTPALRELRRAGEALRPLIERDWCGGLRPCHIDPAPHNFIAVDHRHFLLDWEYAAMCTPLWDLAGISIEGHFDAQQDRAMVALYFGEGADVAAWQSRLHLYRIMLRLVAASWGAAHIAESNGAWTAAELVDPLVALTAADLADPALGRYIERAG